VIHGIREDAVMGDLFLLSEPCIPSSRSRKIPFDYDKALYRQRHKVENLFAKLKDWRRIATRDDRCAHTFFSAICIAAAVIFWI
jgi:transposase